VWLLLIYNGYSKTFHFSTFIVLPGKKVSIIFHLKCLLVQYLKCWYMFYSRNICRKDLVCNIKGRTFAPALREKHGTLKAE